jgi:hypothetical protein
MQQIERFSVQREPSWIGSYVSTPHVPAFLMSQAQASRSSLLQSEIAAQLIRLLQISRPRRRISAMDGMEVDVLDRLDAGMAKRELVDQRLHRRVKSALFIRSPIEDRGVHDEGFLVFEQRRTPANVAAPALGAEAEREPQREDTLDPSPLDVIVTGSSSARRWNAAGLRCISKAEICWRVAGRRFSLPSIRGA